MTQLTDSAPPPAWSGGAAPPPPEPDRPWVTPLRVLAALLAVATIVVVVASVVTSFFARQETFTRTFEEPVTRVEVTTDVGDIDVRAGVAGEAAQVVARSTVAFGEPQLSAAVTGETLVVGSSCDAGWTFGIDRCSVDLDLVVPAGATLTVRSSVGDVRVTGVAEAVSVRMDAGDVRLIETTGAVRVRSDVGDITGSDLGGSADGEIQAGDLRLGFRTPPTAVVAGTDVGEVVVRVPAGPNLDPVLVHRLGRRRDQGGRPGVVDVGTNHLGPHRPGGIRVLEDESDAAGRGRSGRPGRSQILHRPHPAQVLRAERARRPMAPSPRPR